MPISPDEPEPQEPTFLRAALFEIAAPNREAAEAEWDANGPEVSGGVTLANAATIVTDRAAAALGIVKVTVDQLDTLVARAREAGVTQLTVGQDWDDASRAVTYRLGYPGDPDPAAEWTVVDGFGRPAGTMQALELARRGDHINVETASGPRSAWTCGVVEANDPRSGRIVLRCGERLESLAYADIRWVRAGQAPVLGRTGVAC